MRPKTTATEKDGPSGHVGVPGRGPPADRRSHQVFRIRLLGHGDIVEGVTRCPAQVPALVESRTIACTPKVAKRREMGSGGDFYGGLSRGERPIFFSLGEMRENRSAILCCTSPGKRANLDDCFGLSNVLCRTCSALCVPSLRGLQRLPCLTRRSFNGEIVQWWTETRIEFSQTRESLGTRNRLHWQSLMSRRISCRWHMKRMKIGKERCGNKLKN